jgi:hypothetical protein
MTVLAHEQPASDDNDADAINGNEKPAAREDMEEAKGEEWMVRGGVLTEGVLLLCFVAEGDEEEEPTDEHCGVSEGDEEVDDMSLLRFVEEWDGFDTFPLVKKVEAGRAGEAFKLIWDNFWVKFSSSWFKSTGLFKLFETSWVPAVFEMPWVPAVFELVELGLLLKCFVKPVLPLALAMLLVGLHEVVVVVVVVAAVVLPWTSSSDSIWMPFFSRRVPGPTGTLWAASSPMYELIFILL